MAIDFKESKTRVNLMRAFAGESQARNRYTFAADTAKKQCEYLLEKLKLNPADYIYCTCFVERTAELSRYVDFSGYDKGLWEEYRNKAVQFGTQVIRFCNKKEWVERTHFALAWVYIHDRYFTGAREHIMRFRALNPTAFRRAYWRK